jgi:hypothetical protein
MKLRSYKSGTGRFGVYKNDVQLLAEVNDYLDDFRVHDVERYQFLGILMRRSANLDSLACHHNLSVN